MSNGVGTIVTVAVIGVGGYMLYKSGFGQLLGSVTGGLDQVVTAITPGITGVVGNIGDAANVITSIPGAILSLPSLFINL